MIAATTEIDVGLDSRGLTVVRRMCCEVPMLVRVVSSPNAPMLQLAMVNGAAGPLGGDRLAFRLHVGAGARLAVCSVAAAMAQPGPRGERSELLIEINVDEGAVARLAA